MIDEIQKACGHTLVHLQAINGGDVCMAYKGYLQDGSYIFIKCHDRTELLATEAEGLRWLKGTQTIFTPEIICFSDIDAPKGFLVLEWIESSSASLPDWENLGYALAALHRVTSIEFGWHRNNFLGTLTQSNLHGSNWGEFFAKQRILPLLNRAEKEKKISPELSRRLNNMLGDIDTLLPTQEPPCAIHGDLWSGNHLFTEFGEPYFIDPAPYWGNREMDLAMMELFGGFHPRVFAAYNEAYPLLPGWADRRSILQLYYLLAHVLLHGQSWSTSIEATLIELGY